jgi:hypothetical protein
LSRANHPRPRTSDVAVKSRAGKYRERARLIRSEAETVTAAVRRDLLDIAQEYELLADCIEGLRFRGLD